MSAENEKFAGSAGCMDGRDRQGVQSYAGTDVFVDDVCSGPGTVGVLANPEHPLHDEFVAKLKLQIPVSYGKHGSRSFYVSGHAECAGHPVDDETHHRDILAAAELVVGVLLELGYDDA